MPLVIAHRGASAEAPENTMPAFERAIEQGAEMIELDVRQTRDGALVVFHDRDTARWNGVATPIRQLSLAEVQRLDIDGASVPELDQVCELARAQNIQLNIELKQRDIAAAVLACVVRQRMVDQVLISCFHPAPLRQLAELTPRLRCGYLMAFNSLRPLIGLREPWPLAALRRAKVQAWHPAYQMPLLDRLIRLVRGAGFSVNVWTVNELAIMQQLIEQGVDGIITDRPALLYQLLH